MISDNYFFREKNNSCLQTHGVEPSEGALTWAFEFEDHSYFAGFRAMASNGIDLPVLNVFRVFGKMAGQRISAQSSAAVGLDAILKGGVRANPDVGALASLEGNKLSVLVWHYHDDDVPGPDAAVDLTVSGLPPAAAEAQLSHYRIDENHSNAYAAWKRMGSPAAPTRGQYRQIEQAGQLVQQETTSSASTRDGQFSLAFSLPRQAISLLVVEWQ